MQKALEAYTKAVARRSNFEPSYVRRAHAFTALAIYDLALKDLDNAISLDPNDVDSLIDRADLREKLSQIDEAKEDYARALKLNPDHYVHAIEDLDRSISIDPSHALYWNNRCYVRALKNEAAAALPDRDRAISIKKEDLGIRDTRALVLLKMGRFDDALADYNEALRINPKLAQSLYGRSIAKREKKDPRGSESDRKAAIQIKPNVAADFRRFGLAP